MLRVLCSLALQETRQSNVIRKLASNKAENSLKKALWQWDSIIELLFILEYIDSAEVRQNIETALNRGESYHALRRAISIDNDNFLKPRTDVEIELWCECSRLIANCIVNYNSWLISEVLKLEKPASPKLLSPISWGHIKFHGIYSFIKGRGTNLELIKKRLSFGY